MAIEVIKIILRFLLLIAVQVAVLNHIELTGLINPYLYVMALLALPFKMPKGAVMIVALITGFAVGVFTNNAGLHASACVMLAFVRPGVFKLLSPREGYESDTSPSVKHMGLRWYLIYAALLIFVHHATLFYLEVFSFNAFFTTLIRTFLSTCFTLFLIIIVQYLFSKTKTER
ncbi:MAG: rod shape-determining protein MreD [Bacteroidia bacterium]|nr:rod shape-determining protein MreD [Bacteroidia bacterium]